MIKPPPPKRPHGALAQSRPTELTQFIAQQSNLEDDEEDVRLWMPAARDASAERGTSAEK